MVVVELVLTVVSLVGIGVGSFLRHDAYPAHDVVGKAAEAVGWVGTIVGFALAQHHAAQVDVDCRVFHHCTTPTLRGLVADWVRPAVVDVARAALASGAGWLVARTTKRVPEGGQR